MKRRMEQLLNGRFEYEVPKLTLSDTQINLTTNEGENVRGELYVAAEDNRRIKGMTMSSNRRVLLAKEKFSGTTVCIPYGLDVKGLSAGETVDAVITINSNLGEYQVPVHAEITDDGIQTSRGAVDNLEAFTNLARVISGGISSLYKRELSESAAGRRSGIRKPVPGDVQKPGDLSAYGRVSDRNREKRTGDSASGKDRTDLGSFGYYSQRLSESV